MINRREFMTASAGIAAGLGLGAVSSGAQTPAAGRGAGSAPVSSLTFKTKPHKALIARPTEDDLKRMKDAGFEGVEGRVIPVDEAAKMRAVADKIGMRVHSVLYGWAEFNSPDKSEVERTFAESQAALRTAEAFGADTVLLVPCRIGSRGGRAGGEAALRVLRHPAQGRAAGRRRFQQSVPPYRGRAFASPNARRLDQTSATACRRAHAAHRRVRRRRPARPGAAGSGTRFHDRARARRARRRSALRRVPKKRSTLCRPALSRRGSPTQRRRRRSCPRAVE